MANKRETSPDPIPSELAQSDESFVELVEEFVNELDQRIAEMGQAAEKQNFELVQSLAHQLKGCAGGYGYPIITERAANLELSAKAEEVEAVNTSLTDLVALVARVVVKV